MSEMSRAGHTANGTHRQAKATWTHACEAAFQGRLLLLQRSPVCAGCRHGHGWVSLSDQFRPCVELDGIRRASSLSCPFLTSRQTACGLGRVRSGMNALLGPVTS